MDRQSEQIGRGLNSSPEDEIKADRGRAESGGSGGEGPPNRFEDHRNHRPDTTGDRGVVRSLGRGIETSSRKEEEMFLVRK